MYWYKLEKKIVKREYLTKSLVMKMYSCESILYLFVCYKIWCRLRNLLPEVKIDKSKDCQKANNFLYGLIKHELKWDKIQVFWLKWTWNTNKLITKGHLCYISILYIPYVQSVWFISLLKGFLFFFCFFCINYIVMIIYIYIHVFVLIWFFYIKFIRCQIFVLHIIYVLIIAVILVHIPPLISRYLFYPCHYVMVW